VAEDDLNGRVGAEEGLGLAFAAFGLKWIFSLPCMGAGLADIGLDNAEPGRVELADVGRENADPGRADFADIGLDIAEAGLDNVGGADIGLDNVGRADLADIGLDIAEAGLESERRKPGHDRCVANFTLVNLERGADADLVAPDLSLPAACVINQWRELQSALSRVRDRYGIAPKETSDFHI